MDTAISIHGLEYAAARRELEKLLREFEEAADGPESYPPLGHQLISPLDGPWTNNQWSNFIKANTHSNGEWQECEVFPGGVSCGRFFGSDISLDWFTRMAERAIKTLKKISTLKEEGKAILPDGLILCLPSADGCQGWLQLLYETARRYPTAFLHSEPGNWGCTGQFNWNESTQPFCEELRYDLFQSSAEAIHLFFAPPTEEEIAGERITDKPPVYLPPEPQQNGPYPPNEFWLWGTPYEFSGKAWLLLEFLWGKWKVKSDDAKRNVYGEADDWIDDGAFLSTVKRLQSELRNQNCPVTVHIKKDPRDGEKYITLEATAPSECVAYPIALFNSH